MREFKSLRPQNLPLDYDVEIQTEEPIVTVEETESQIAVSYLFPGFYLADTPQQVGNEKVNFQLVDIHNIGTFAESGRPMLPSFGRYLSVPPDTTYKVKVEKGQPVTFDNVLVTPAQAQMTDRNLPNRPAEFEYDKSFYQKDLLFPENVVEVSGPMEVGGYNALLVHVSPVQYNPAKRQLLGYGNIKITLTLTHKVSDRPTTPRVPGTDQEAFANFFLNRPIELTIQPRTIEPIGPMPFKPDPTQYLIIYYDKFVAAAEKLAQWKNERGLRTKTLAISTIGNTAAQIKTFIRNWRGRPLNQLRYVLLLGDADMIAPSEQTSDMLTDYFYSIPSDTDGILPWLSLGRFPLRTAQEAVDVVTEVIEYEKNPPTAPDFYKHMLVAGYFEADYDHRDYVYTMEQIQPILVAQGYNAQRVYTSAVNPPTHYHNGTPIPPEVVAAVVTPALATKALSKAASEGRLIFGHRDHGSPQGWYQPPFTVTDLDSVTGKMPSLWFSINCQTGRFDYKDTATGNQKESFAEKLLRIKSTAPSLIAATRDTGTYVNNALILALYDAMFSGVLPSFPGGAYSYPLVNNRLGDILNYARSYLPIAFRGDVAGNTREWKLYHVIGDPTLELWKQAPLPFKVGATFAGNKVLISLSSCPSGCVVTIWQQGKLVQQLQPTTKFMVVSLNGVPLFPLGRPSPVHICCWAPGYHFAETTVTAQFPVLHPVP